MELAFFPTLNASLNALTTCFLLAGFIAIKNGRKVTHRALMIGALTSSTVFLGCYLYYHFHFPTTPFPRHDWTRPLYFAILIPHVILATVMLPFIFMAVYRAARGEFEKHKRITRWLWPVWMYVSVTGVLVYLMLYHWCR